MRLKSNFKLIIIIILFVIINILFLFSYQHIWWDPAVYIGMGKYIFSLGQAGLWEPSRPLVLPIFLGSLWKMGFEVIVFRIFTMLFGVGLVYLTYLIGKEIFTKKVGIIAALFLAFSPTFFFFNPMIWTSIPSAFFALLGIFFFIKKRYFLVGVFSGLAFMTRFLQFGVYLILFLFLILNYKKEKDLFKKIKSIITGFLIVVGPYLVFNFIMYNSIFYPFFLQSFMTKYTGWLWHEPLWFYIFNLLKENFLVIFSLIGLFFISKMRKRDNKKVISYLLIIYFVFFTLTKHKEMRFTIVLLPYLYLISSFGLIKLLQKIKNKKFSSRLLIIIIVVLSIQYSIQILPMFDYGQYTEDKSKIFQDYLDKEEVKNGIWISNPLYGVNSNKKIDELMYFPTYNHDKHLELKSKFNSANNVLINTCDLYCEPYNTYCENDKNELINLFKANFNIVFYEKEEDCRLYIFTS